MRARYVAGALDAAARTANALLRLDDGCADAHLVLSRIQLAKGNHRAALASLDNAVANNFAVRESPAFAVISAQCKVLDDNLEGSLADLEAALKLPGVKKAMTVKEEEAARKKRDSRVGAGSRHRVFAVRSGALQTQTRRTGGRVAQGGHHRVRGHHRGSSRDDRAVRARDGEGGHATGAQVAESSHPGFPALCQGDNGVGSDPPGAKKRPGSVRPVLRKSRRERGRRQLARRARRGVHDRRRARIGGGGV